jgi:glycosyltransferase involved in cell wall biosynthesis
VEPDCEVATLTAKHGCGRLAEPGDPRSMADAILEFYRDREGTARAGAQARAASSAFDRKLQVLKYYDLFQSVIPAPRERAATLERRA